MTSLSDLRKGDVASTTIVLIVGGLGFYLAIALSDAVKSAVDRAVPDTEDELLRNWISLAVAVVVVLASLYILFNFFGRRIK